MRSVSALDKRNENPLNIPRVINPRTVKLNWSVSFRALGDEYFRN